MDFQKLRKQLRELADGLSKAEEQADECACDVEEMAKLAKDRQDGGGKQAPPPRQLPRKKPDPALRPAALRLVIERHPDEESVQVAIDAAKPFRLPRLLGEWLDILAHDTGYSSDNLVILKDRHAAANLLAERMGRRFKPGAINNLNLRLRKALHGLAGLPPDLIEVAPQGMRFRLSRERGALIAPESL